MSGRDDIIVWEEIKSGSRDALEELYCHYSGSLIRYGIHITPEIYLIEDTLHDLFLHLWTNREKTIIKVSVRLYLYRAFRNNLVRAVIKKRELSYGRSGDFFPGDVSDTIAEGENYGRRGERRGESGDRGETADFEKYAGSVDSEESPERENRCNSVANALTKLGMQQREIVCLRFFNDLSNKEIAQVLNIREQTVKNVLGKSLRKLRSMIDF